MKNRIKNLLLTYSLNMAFIAILLGSSLIFIYHQLHERILLLFSAVLIFSLLPMVSYFRTIINSYISPIRYSDLYVQTVDLILNIRSFDEVLRQTFDQILHLIKVNTGLLIFYYHDKDEFKIFYQKNLRKKIIKRARISQDNILLRAIKGPDDVVIKGRLNASIRYEKEIIDELDRLSGEVVVPIYYHNMFLGLIITGDRKRRFTEGELRLLKIFASKIAILSVNSFFFGEVVRKEDLQREYELATRVQKRFLPSHSVGFGRLRVRVFHEASSSMVREFYDVFVNDTSEDDLRISAYRILGDITGTSILMPGIQSIIQSFARLGYPPSGVLRRLKRILRQKELVDERIILFHGSLNRSGEISYASDGYSAPILFNGRKAAIHAMRKTAGDAVRRIRLDAGDFFILCSESYFAELSGRPKDYSALIAGSGTLDGVGGALEKALGSAVHDDSDKLLILIGIEEAR